MTDAKRAAFGEGNPLLETSSNGFSDSTAKIATQVTLSDFRTSWSVFDGPEYMGRIVRRLTPAARPGASVGEHLRRMADRVRRAGWFEAFDRGGHSVGIFHSRSKAALALKAASAPFDGYPCLICGAHECDDAEACALEEMRQVRRRLA